MGPDKIEIRFTKAGVYGRRQGGKRPAFYLNESIRKTYNNVALVTILVTATWQKEAAERVKSINY